MSRNTFEPDAVHEALDTAAQAYHAIFDTHVPDEVHRFDAFLSTLRMIVDQSADMAPKNLKPDA